MSLVKAAAAFVPMLAVRRAATERDASYAEDIHAAFGAAGFHRMLTPGEYGGLGVSLDTYARVIMVISSGCPSSGWQLNLGASHTPIVCSLFDSSALRELFVEPDFVCAAVTAPQGEARRLGDGDWSVTGVFNYASGIPYATHFLGHALTIEPGREARSVLTFLIPRGQWRMLDDWDRSLGLKGSGSHSVEISEARVPARFVVEGSDMINANAGGQPRARPGDTELARHGRLLSFNMICTTAMSVGMLKGAIDEYCRLMAVKKTARPPITPRHENPDYQRWLGSACAKLSVAQSAVSALSSQWTASAQRAQRGGAAFSPQEDSRIAGACSELLDYCWDTFQRLLWPSAGTSTAMNGEAMQRFLRDMAMARSHVVSVMGDELLRDLARRTFSAGAPATDGLWSILP